MGIEEEHLQKIQQDIQARLKERDEAQERNITKKLQEFKKKYDFINAALLRSVAQVSEMFNPDTTTAVGRLKSADRMVMMPGLFDGEKPEKAKQHYERFSQYMTFQTMSGNIKDPIKEAIELFEQTLDKKALVWFQEHRDKFTDLTTLKTLFLQRYNPWGEMKREQLQSWNHLSFDPQKTDVDEQNDLVNTLGDMLGQKTEAKIDMFIETMPTIIQTHLVTGEDWAAVTKKANELENIICKCKPLVVATSSLAPRTAVPSLYSHIAH